MSHSIASALAEKDTNLQSTQQQNNQKFASAGGEENKSMDTEQHKQVLSHIAKQNKQPGTYVSPSDAILSPASSKLAGFKQRQINKQ
jgi:phosphoribosylamine-glycine ligase